MFGVGKDIPTFIASEKKNTCGTQRRILLVEDLPLLARATTDILVSEFPEHLIDGASTLADVEALTLTSYERLFVDLNIPGANGLSLVRHIASAGHAERTCIVTQHSSPSFIAEAMSLGMLGYIGKWESIPVFREKLRAVMNGQRTFPSVSVESADIIQLSERELAVLELLRHGCHTKAAANQLGLSDITLKRTISDLKLRLNSKTRAQAVATAIKAGLLSSPEE
jgi:two-component system response regulator DesR